MSIKFYLTLCLATACSTAFGQGNNGLEKKMLSAPCDSFARDATAKEARKPIEIKSPVRELCFPGDQSCIDNGGLLAENIWENASNPEKVKSALLEYSNWRGVVSEASMLAEHGKLIRIARFVGSAQCVRDTYFLYQKGKYRLIDSPSLDNLSAEATNCGDAEIMLKEVGEPLLVTMLYGVVTAYRFDRNFALNMICSVRYRARRTEP